MKWHWKETRWGSLTEPCEVGEAKKMIIRLLIDENFVKSFTQNNDIFVKNNDIMIKKIVQNNDIMIQKIIQCSNKYYYSSFRQRAAHQTRNLWHIFTSDRPLAGFNSPYLLCIFGDHLVTAKLPRVGSAKNAHLSPFLLIHKCFINSSLTIIPIINLAQKIFVVTLDVLCAHGVKVPLDPKNV